MRGLVSLYQKQGGIVVGYGIRQPTSNDLPSMVGNRWLDTDEWEDERALLITGRAARCRKCERATSNRHLEDGYCPDCR